MVGSHGPIGPWLSHKLCSTVNMTPTMKVAIDCSHHELHKDIQIKILMVIQLVNLRVSYSFLDEFPEK